MTIAQLTAVRRSVLKWWQGFGRFRDEETRQLKRGRANVLQRRLFEHYRHCQELKIPCRAAVLKYRRAGSSTASEAIIYVHSQNYNSRLALIGTDYKASDNMLKMQCDYAASDDFPGWSMREGLKTGQSFTAGQRVKIRWQDYYGNEDLESVAFKDRVDKVIATKIEWKHGSTVELYTAKNPESARSAGLSGYHATESGRWPVGGAQDGGETLVAMRNTLPKKGFHVAIEESTAKGAQGVFYDTCKSAKWPAYADWWKKWETCWPLTQQAFGSDLQFTLIFAAWFEDDRHVDEITPEQEALLKETLDANEKELIALYQEDGPKGPRLGGEVNATLWQQLAWRRGIIASVCTKGGKDEFDVEYPHSPLVAFKASGSPALDQEGITALEVAYRNAPPPEYGTVTHTTSGATLWQATSSSEAAIWLWEHPIPGAKYIITGDPMTGAEEVTGDGEKDRHGVFVIRDKFMDTTGRFYPVRVVARIKPPCQWEDKPLARYIHHMSLYYGRCIIVIEANMGIAIIKELRDVHHANLFVREQFDTVSQKFVEKLGWWNESGSRRIAISELQSYVREQKLDLTCPHAIGEFKTLIINSKGKACASGSNHDDDALAIAIGLVALPSATTYSVPVVQKPEAPDARKWKEL